MIPHYEVQIHWSDADSAYIASATELPACLADGRTRTAAVKNLERVIQEWIDAARRMGRPVPRPRRR